MSFIVYLNKIRHVKAKYEPYAILIPSWGVVNLPTPRKNYQNFKNNALKWPIFVTFSFYLLDTISKIFGTRAFLERKLKAISQQDVTRMGVWARFL